MKNLLFLFIIPLLSFGQSECPPLVFTNASPDPINGTELTVEWTGGCQDLNTIYLTFVDATNNQTIINTNWENGNALLPNSGSHTWNLPCDLIDVNNEYTYYIAQLYNGTSYETTTFGNPDWQSVLQNGGSTILTDDPIYWGSNFEGNPGGNPCVATVLNFPDVPLEYVCSQSDFYEHFHESLGYYITISGDFLCIEGCTDSCACNYNEFATVDDNLCDYSCYSDTVYVTDTIYVMDTIVDTQYVEVFITDTLELVVTEYLDCDTGLPCQSGMSEIIEKSKIDNRLYNLLGQEIFRREGIYIENGKLMYR